MKNTTVLLAIIFLLVGCKEKPDFDIESFSPDSLLAEPHNQIVWSDMTDSMYYKRDKYRGQYDSVFAAINPKRLNSVRDPMAATKAWAFIPNDKGTQELAMGEFVYSEDEVLYKGAFYRQPFMEISPVGKTLASLFSSKSESEKFWKKLLASCMGSPIDKKQRFNGISASDTTFSVGTLVDIKTNKPTMILMNYLKKPELRHLIKRLIVYENNASCQIPYSTSGRDFSSSVNLSTPLAEGDLIVAVSNSRNTRSSVSNYNNSYLLVSELRNLLKNTDDTDLLTYRDELLSKRNYIILSRKKVLGFTAEIETAIDHYTSIKAKLDSGLIYNIDSIGSTISFKRQGENKIMFSSSQVFVPFSELGRVKVK
jgi:hypothetical protein